MVAQNAESSSEPYSNHMRFCVLLDTFVTIMCNRLKPVITSDMYLI